jgi:hypothetical protein
MSRCRSSPMARYGRWRITMPFAAKRLRAGDDRAGPDCCA